MHALSSCNHRHSLREVLDAPNVMNMIKDTKAAQEVQYRPPWLIYATCFLFISNTMKVKRCLPLSVIFSFRKRKKNNSSSASCISYIKYKKLIMDVLYPTMTFLIGPFFLQVRVLQDFFNMLSNVSEYNLKCYSLLYLRLYLDAKWQDIRTIEG